MKNLYLVESPFQLICAIEANENIETNNIPSILIVKKTNSKKNNNQIFKILEHTNFDEVKIIPFVFLGIISDFIAQLFIFKWKLKRKKFNTIFIGEVKNTIFRCFGLNFKSNNVYFLDDGIATIAIQEKLKNGISIEEQTIENKKTAPFRNLIFKLLGIKYKYNQIPNWFTCFDLTSIEKQTILINKFSTIKSKIKKSVGDINDNTIYFIGSSIAEDGRIPIENELEMIREMSKYYNKENKKIVYCSHRRESEYKLNEISKIPNITKIRHAQYPLEIDFSINNVNLTHVSSFISTSLITLSKIYNVEKIDMIIFPENVLDKNYVLYYRNIKNEFERITEINKITI